MVSSAIRTYDEQANRLLARGLQADKAALIRELQLTGELRLSSYAEFFRAADGNYRPGTTLTSVQRLCEFDHRLRLLCFEAIGIIEVQVRSQLVYRFARSYRLYSYLDKNNFPKFSDGTGGFSGWEGKIKAAIESARKDGLNPVNAGPSTTGGVQPVFPIWTIAERMDFGTTLSFFNGVSSEIKKAVAETAGLTDVLASSWLSSLRDLRNRCAHHHRVWNWRFRNSARIPRIRKFPQWHSPEFPSNRHIGILLTICRYWLNRIQPGNSWTKRVLALFDAHPELPAAAMGFPADWRRHPLWAA